MTDLIIGLDVSTAVTGYAVLDAKSGQLVDLGYIDTRKTRSLWLTGDEIRKKLTLLATAGSYTGVYVEESLQRFRSGFSSAHTLSTLAKINGLTSYMARDTFGIDPLYIGSIVARGACGIKVRRAATKAEKKDTRFVKQQVFDQMILLYPDLSKQSSHVWPLTRPSKVNPSGRMQDCCYDMMDAYVIAMAGYKGCKNYAI